MTERWLAAFLNSIAESAKEHPFLVGILLLVILVSTGIHILIFGGYLLLGISKYLRRQAAELLNMRDLFLDEGDYWRQIFDVLRVRSMSSKEIEAELRRRNIDAAKTTEIVTTLVETLLVQLRSKPVGTQDTSGNDRADE